MLAFAGLLERLVLTQSRNARVAMLVDHLRRTPDPDRGWAIAAITGDLKLASIKAAGLRDLVASRTDPELFALSYEFVGDLAETISLMWPSRPGANRTPELSEVIETLAGATRAEARDRVETWLDALDATGRWALLKLVTGGLRVGVSARLARQALADFGSVDVTEIEEIWHGQEAPYLSLFAWLEGGAAKPVSGRPAPFRPVMLSHPLLDKPTRQQDDLPASLDASIAPEQFAAEWKWDGVRIQLSCEGETRRLYTRTGDDISVAFPEIVERLEFEGALDGELLVRTPEGGVAPFGDLQQRLNRRTVTARQVAERPAFMRAYDILFEDGADLRPLPFRQRRKHLERAVVSLVSARLDLSPLIRFNDLRDLDDIRRNPPAPEIEGVMLKRWDAPYLAGRPVDCWYKWKRDPMRIDAVLMYAQRGHGRRSGLYSDFSFGVWRQGEGGDELTPVGKAYFGFTDEELKELDRYVNANQTERFGPVRGVRADKQQGLVLEIAFEGVQRSARHRSGVALRFPRIERIRWDKPSSEADRIEALEALLQS